MIQSSEHITCLAAWQSRSWDMRGKRNTGWNSMWSCAIPAANFLMLIYGYNHNKHPARPARACTPGTRWKESLVQTQISHTHQLEAALMPKCRVWLATAKMAPRLLLANHKVISALPEQTVVSVFVPKWLNPCVPCFKADISFQTDLATALCFSPFSCGAQFRTIYWKIKSTLPDKNEASDSFVVSFGSQPAAFSSHRQGRQWCLAGVLIYVCRSDVNLGFTTVEHKNGFLAGLRWFMVSQVCSYNMHSFILINLTIFTTGLNSISYWSPAI